LNADVESLREIKEKKEDIAHARMLKEKLR